MPRSTAFFNGSPFLAASYHRKWAAVQPRFGSEAREQAAAALRPTSPRAAERLRRFVVEGGAVVTTGQQTGLFTGPLYTIYKILSAIRLAQALEQDLGVSVLPVFWAASEDHDWEEANHIHVVTGQTNLHRIQLPPTDPRPLPMSDLVLGTGVESVLENFAHLTPDCEDKERLLKWLRASYKPGATVAGAFREMIERLFAPFDLLVADAADPALKRASVPTLLREIQAAEEHEARLAETTQALLTSGYHAQVGLISGATNLFLHGVNGRERLYRDGERWVTRESRWSFFRSDLENMVREEPKRFSPNVFLRPVVESTVFPVLAYVAGPGEISYFAQLGGLFAAGGTEAPVVVPRFSLTLVEEKIGRALQDLGLSVQMLATPEHELQLRLTRGAVPSSVASALAELRHASAERYAHLLAEARQIDPMLDGALGAHRNAVLAEIARSERKILKHVKANNQARLEKLARVRAHLYPLGVPQERVLNVFPFLFRYGLGLLGDLSRQMEVVWE